MISDREGLAQAYLHALDSPDPSTQNGSMLINFGIVIGASCNKFPRGVAVTDERLQRPLKYEVIEHAERNAIYEAARLSYSTLGATLYCPWAACADCARAIIQAGVTRLVRHDDATKRGQGRNWDGSISIADVMLREAGVEIVDVMGKVFTDPMSEIELLHSGEMWRP